MKKIILITALVIMLTIIIGWHTKIFSQNNLPFPKPITCKQSYIDTIFVFEKAWEDNLQSLLDQEKPTSKKVDEAFENMRSYRCMLEYTCRAVQYSGTGHPNSAEEKGLTSAHIGKIAGCQAPEDIGLPNEFEVFMKNVLTLGYNQNQIQYNKFPFMEQCAPIDVKRGSNAGLNLSINNFNECMTYVDAKFACKNNIESPKNCTDESIAFVKLETALKKDNAKQKTNAFENKLNTIVTKMLNMEAHVGYLQSKLRQLDNRYMCFPNNCS